jgi:Tfp pilus assembly protein PilW
MVELLVTIVAGAIVILGVYRLLGQSLWSYNMQEQMTDMSQNATYTMKRLSEVLAEVGSYLPEKNYTVVLFNAANPDSVCMRINKKSAKQAFSAVMSATAKIPVDSGNAFKGADSLVKRDTGGVVTVFKIDSVKVSSTPDTVYLKSPATAAFIENDAVYATATTRYFLSGTNFCCDTITNVLAENIDSLAMTFYDSSHTATTDWAKMRSVAICVRGKTLSRDPKYKSPGFNDGYHRLKLDMEIRLRNRF